MDLKKILFKTSSIDADKALPDAVIFTNGEWKIQWVNDVASEIFDTSKMHLLTSKISDFIENINNLVSNALSGNRSVIAKLKDKELYYDMTVRKIDEGYVFDLRNINDFSKNNMQIPRDIQASVDKNNFLIKLSNDLKSPIQSIVGFSQAMSDGLGGSMTEQQEKYVRIINKNSVDLMYFIAKLLELSKTECELLIPDVKPVDTAALVNSVVKFNEQLYKGKDVKITIKQTEIYNKIVNTDQDILRNILQDLLEVVLKSIDMGEVLIFLSEPSEEEIQSKGLMPDKYSKISLSSSSLLLSENDLEFMFDPYKIIDSANRKNVLRAIVLSSVKNLLQSLGGIIWVESQILKSSSFNIIIPVN